MQQSSDNQPAFFCDAMLGGLARWLRAAGYDAEFRHGIADSVIIAEALETGRTLLSCDGPMFERKVIRDGQLKALFIPRQLTRTEQLIFVVEKLSLTRRPARCMACGGELLNIPKHTVISEAPPLAYRSCDTFFRCKRCDKLLWRGTHWQAIDARLKEIFEDQSK
jgi:uncharacterized protein with PIN domain